MEKIVCIGANYGSGVMEFPQLDELLEDGWYIVKMKPVSTGEKMCCYVWLDDSDYDDDEEYDEYDDEYEEDDDDNNFFGYKN